VLRACAFKAQVVGDDEREESRMTAATQCKRRSRRALRRETLQLGQFRSH
jgi:hypothetical protein